MLYTKKKLAVLFFLQKIFDDAPYRFFQIPSFLYNKIPIAEKFVRVFWKNNSTPGTLPGAICNKNNKMIHHVG